MLTRLADLGGSILRTVFGAMLLVRQPRPIHSRGRVLEGHIAWLPGAEPSGIRWMDEAPVAPVPVVARLSRGIGLPAPLPDLIGLAMRVPAHRGIADGGVADIELASNGLGVPGRFLLFPHRSASRAWFGSLFPYASERGPVLLGARQVSPGVLPSGGAALDATLRRDGWRLRLYHATPRGLWHPFAEVTLHPRDGRAQDDPTLRFDSVRHALPGAGTYRWVRALRQPTYHLVQRTGDDAVDEASVR